MTSGSIGSRSAANHAPARPMPVTISSKQTRKPYRSRLSSSPRQKRSGGEYAGSAAALIGSQKNAGAVSGPNSSITWSRAASAVSPLGSGRQVGGGTWGGGQRYGWRRR